MLASVDHRLLSQVLGCEPAQILPLIESSSLQGLIGHRSVRDACFDLVTLAKQIEQLETVASGQIIDMVHAARIASAHGGHMGHVLAGILLKEIPFRPKSDRKALLDGAFVGVDGLLAWMAKHLASLETAHCTLLDTIAITGMNKQEITTACSLGLIKPLGWKRELCFQGGEISRLLSSHISIKRWSKISGIPARRPLASLTESSFEAAIGGVLYSRTEELDSWLNRFTSR
ncbi:MAG: hypothetical protein JL55_34635 [Pseudomonas sp. BICA1-14]|nr:MAG: hypothetical protein JL55_34635 [[Pseudomonas] sp. BICA1-14]